MNKTDYEEGVHFKNNIARAFDHTGAELLDDSFQKLDQAFILNHLWK